MSFPPDDPQLTPEPARLPGRINLLILYALITLGVLLFTIFLASRGATRAADSTGSSPATTLATVEVNPTTPAALAAAATGESDTSTPVIATNTPTLRATFTQRPTATFTITPTSTPTPTRTLSPSLTPAVPLEENERYTFLPWTPELAERLMDLLEAYPETLSTFARGEDNSGYYSAFDNAILIQREALLRLETAPQARDWLWRLAYNQARTGEREAVNTFTFLITEELNAGRVLLADLPLWGAAQEPSVLLEAIPVETPAGLLGSFLVKISAGENGSAFFWLLEEPNGFESYPLTNDFDFIHPSQVNYFIGDVTGDGRPEVGIFRAQVSGTQNYALPRVFQLNQQPPLELAFDPPPLTAIGPDFENKWEPVIAGESEGDLQFISDVFPPCPVTVRHTYDWNGQAFDFLGESYTLNPVPDLLSYCSLVVEHSVNVWSLDTTIQIMEALLPNWPPTSTIDGTPFPADALDEWRFRLSVYHALNGTVDQARGYANSILSNPATVSSRWITPVQEFVDAYQSPRDIYRACLLTRFCDPRKAFEALIGTLSPADFPQIQEIFREAGVQMRSNGFFDFDADGETERWVLLRHQPGGQLEFWVLIPGPERVEALFIDFLEHDQPNITYLEPADDPPFVQVGTEITFQLFKDLPGREPAISLAAPPVVFSADRTQQVLDQVEAELLEGGDPAQAREALIDLEGSSFFTCSYILCPRFFYLLGLSNELAGNETEAVEAYLELWRRYLGHPLVTAARLKLAGPAIPPGPTITPTRTGTRPTPTRTGTISAPARTSTPTPTLSGAQPSPTQTSTLPGYPYP
jgi:hypothetical protein